GIRGRNVTGVQTCAFRSASRSAPRIPIMRTLPPHSGTGTSSYSRSSAFNMSDLLSKAITVYLPHRYEIIGRRVPTLTRSTELFPASPLGRRVITSGRELGLSSDLERDARFGLIVMRHLRLKASQERLELPPSAVRVRKHNPVFPKLVAVEIFQQIIVIRWTVIHVQLHLTRVFQSPDELHPPVFGLVMREVNFLTLNTRSRNVGHIRDSLELFTARVGTLKPRAKSIHPRHTNPLIAQSPHENATAHDATPGLDHATPAKTQNASQCAADPR